MKWRWLLLDYVDPKHEQSKPGTLTNSSAKSHVSGSDPRLQTLLLERQRHAARSAP